MATFHHEAPETSSTATTTTVFQAFRAPSHPYPVRIPAVQHPITREWYVIWTDITDCFPGVVRVQHNDVYVPFMRDQDLYRVRPHGIKYHPDTILDIIYADLQQQQQQKKHAKLKHVLQAGQQELLGCGEPLPASQGNGGRTSNKNDHSNKETPVTFGASLLETYLAASLLQTSPSLNGASNPGMIEAQKFGAKVMLNYPTTTTMASSLSSSSRSSTPSLPQRSGFAYGHTSDDFDISESDEDKCVGSVKQREPSKDDTEDDQGKGEIEDSGDDKQGEIIDRNDETAAATAKADNAAKESQCRELSNSMQSLFAHPTKSADEHAIFQEWKPNYQLVHGGHHLVDNNNNISSGNQSRIITTAKQTKQARRQIILAAHARQKRRTTAASGSNKQPKSPVAIGAMVCAAADDMDKDAKVEELKLEVESEANSQPPSPSQQQLSKAIEDKKEKDEKIEPVAAESMLSFAESNQVSKILEPSATMETASRGLKSTASSTIVSTSINPSTKLAADNSIGPLTISPSQSWSPLPDVSEIADPNRLTAANVVRKRVQEILTKRYRWIEASAPKLFIVLPAASWAVNVGQAALEEVASKLSWSDFAVHFLCDCGGRSRASTTFAHSNLTDCPWGHPLTRAVEQSMIERFGDYMMAILEALKFGVVHHENDILCCFPAEKDPELQTRITLAIIYLENQKVKSSQSFLNQDPSGSSTKISDIPSVTPLGKRDFAAISSLFFLGDPRRMLEDTHPILTPERDVRWVCLHHCVTMSPNDAWTSAFRFSGDSASTVTEFRTSTGAFRVVITTRERAREYYKLAEKLVTTSVLRIFLDWEMNNEDEEELRQAIAKFKAACVRVQVRTDSAYSGKVLGFGHGYSDIIFEVLKNKNIEAFVMDVGPKDDPSLYGYNERYDITRTFTTSDQRFRLVRFKRSSKDINKINMRILVTDIDHGVQRIRSMFEGLHHFTKLNLVMEDIHENVSIKFLKPGQPGAEIEDSEYQTGDLLQWLEKRGNQDTIHYRGLLKSDNCFLHSRILTSLYLGYSYARDRKRVWHIIKSNKRLVTVELEIVGQDDPSQIYESYKSLMANHPTLKTFQIFQRHHRMSSEFQWSDMSDPSKMKVRITTHEGDKVASMFQKYATSLSSLDIYGITSQDAAILEKSLRPRKGPFKLKKILIMDAHLMEDSTLEDLRKIILRGSFENINMIVDIRKLKKSIAGYSDEEDSTIGERQSQGQQIPKNNSKAVAVNGQKKTKKKMLTNSDQAKERMQTEALRKSIDFMISIGTKVTMFDVWGANTQRMLQYLAAKTPQTAILPSLKTISIRVKNGQLLDQKWFTEVLFYKSAPIRELWEEHAARCASGKSGARNGGATVHNNNNGISANYHQRRHENDSDKQQQQDQQDQQDHDYQQQQREFVMRLEEISGFTEAFINQHVSGAFELASAAFECPQRIAPLDDVSIQDVEIQAEDWYFLLQALDFREIRMFQLEVASPISGEMLNKLLDAIPDMSCALESCSISVPGPTPEEALHFQQELMKKAMMSRRADDERPTIMVNGYI
ncbi:hypothetical protein BX616_002864 [Lobosporangium transversale]|uniref:Uncharacterized protein n=1 Tax=Lobosporangium transversale TaxID=64571 RepID=A0A1Y2H0B1_9FUNG|nr:hypothetical protein BCR41DRAFT_383638 [Lobosporangium transversale]KAF9899754.1 hypothetical protein BX616_002864 [Lobosporangium transversale]ORZ27987.1 hypothetical protein BCR41DRAFT_383638 [Lobosporangium transversale]|eukprot:XP_021885690.1 hypothetical protein BCR41DRAFT_383638 [Lobosporangium transversale]